MASGRGGKLPQSAMHSVQQVFTLVEQMSVKDLGAFICSLLLPMLAHCQHRQANSTCSIGLTALVAMQGSP